MRALQQKCYYNYKMVDFKDLLGSKSRDNMRV